MTKDDLLKEKEDDFNLDLELDEFETEDGEDKKKEFTIDSVNKADWAIEKVKEEQYRLDMYEQTIKSKIDRLKEDLVKEKQLSEGRTSWLRFKLGEYLHRPEVPAKDTKTLLSLKLASGTIKFTKSKNDFVRNDKALIQYLKDNNKGFVKTEEKVEWGKLKKTLEIKDDLVFDKNTGELIEGINVEMTVPKIEVK